MKPDTVLKLLHKGLSRPSGELVLQFDDRTTLSLWWYDDGHILQMRHSVKRKKNNVQIDLRRYDNNDVDRFIKMRLGIVCPGLEDKRLVKMEER